MSNRRISTEGYAKPKKPKKPAKPKVKPAGQPPRPYSFTRVRANTNIPGGMVDGGTTYRPGSTKAERISGKNALSQVGIGGFFGTNPLINKKTK